MNRRVCLLIVFLVLSLPGSIACSQANREGSATAVPPGSVSRESRIPAAAVKVLPRNDAYAPRVHSQEWEQPMGLGSPVNTAGSEDSPFITPDGGTLYFWFTPDSSIPARKQLNDGVTGIWVSRKTADGWSPPERVVLQAPGETVLDGCPFVLGDQMYFCTARAGNSRGIDMWVAERKDGSWGNWKNVGEKLNKLYQVGELHVSADGNQIYFASDRRGGKGKRDIWVTTRAGGEWQQPVNLETVNSPGEENQPFLTEDGRELWFTGQSTHAPGSVGVFRSRRTTTGWNPPEEIISHFAGEPTLDREGNIYFVHHFFRDGKMLEADIYLARKKKPPAQVSSGPKP